MTVPEQGLHMVAKLQGAACRSYANRDGRRCALGLAPRALSPMYLDAPSQNGLVLGSLGIQRG